jgi:cyanophycinase
MFKKFSALKKNSLLFCLLLVFTITSIPVFAQSTNGNIPNPFFNSKGKLIIIGGGSIPDSLFSFFANYIGGKDQPVVYIPTATTDEEYIQKGEHLIKFTSQGYTNLSTIHTRDKKEADNPKNIELLRNAKGLYFGGGDQQLIADAYAGTKLYDEFIALLNRGGVIMGTSAGATIMGSLMIGGDARDDISKKYNFNPAFSFMTNTALDQHVLVRNRQFDLISVIDSVDRSFLIATSIDHFDQSSSEIVGLTGSLVTTSSFLVIFGILNSSGIFTSGSEACTAGSSETASSTYDSFTTPVFSYVFLSSAISCRALVYSFWAFFNESNQELVSLKFFGISRPWFFT